MIETKEQYETIRANPTALLGDGVLGMYLIETIEALRRFVRAHDKLEAYRIGAVESLTREDYNEQVVEFNEARKSLPDWIADG